MVSNLLIVFLTVINTSSPLTPLLLLGEGGFEKWEFILCSGKSDFIICLRYQVSFLQKRRQFIMGHRQGKRPRINEQIRAPKVLLVDEDAAREVDTPSALELAKGRELDLIEVSPKTNPPVVKIGDFGQYLYQLNKKERKQRAHVKQTEVKTLRLSFRTDRHDVERLQNRAKEFFGERHLVKFVIRLRGRELTKKSYAPEKLVSIVKDLGEVAEVEKDISMQGNQFIVILRGRRGGK